MYFSQRRNGEEGSRRESIGCRRGLGHPHRHFQRRASGVFHRIGAIGMARIGNDWQSLAGMRMKGIINRHGGRHGVVERFSSTSISIASSLRGSISIALTRTSSHVLCKVSPLPTRTSPPWSRRSAGVSSAHCGSWDTWKRASMPRWRQAMIPCVTTHPSSPAPWRPRCSSASPLASGLGSRSGAWAQALAPRASAHS